MTDRITPARSTSASHLSALSSTTTSQRKSVAPGSDNLTIRPRNRRLISTDDDSGLDDLPETGNEQQNIGGLLAQSPLDESFLSKSRNERNKNDGPATLGKFFNESWNSSWSAIQGITNSLIDGSSLTSSRAASPARTRPSALRRQDSRSRSWGPAPPTSNPHLNDVAAGSLAEREVALKAARTASVLESHDGVNGGLDIVGKHKRRNSDDLASQNHRQQDQSEDYLVYVHKVKPSESFVGVVLRYKCREDALRRANGLWSRDSIQTRRWLTIPVDICDIRGRPCDPPSWSNSEQADLLAPTPAALNERQSSQNSLDYFAERSSTNTDTAATTSREREEEDKTWQHVRWVKIDGFTEPIEIGRVSRSAMGYFPPRRRKSLRTISSLSTPRQSLDLSTAGGPAGGSLEGGGARPSSRRMSSLSNRPTISSTPVSSRSRGGSEGHDARPAWMRRPGGVGSMGRNIRAPGPDNDLLNTWTRKHLPGLNIEDLPSMSIMGTEQARLGFAKDSGNLAESSYEDGRDLMALNTAAGRGGSGNGLDKAAAAVETWLRGALSKRPSTPMMRAFGGQRSASGGLSGGLSGLGGEGSGDLIELADTTSDDGKFMLDSGGAAAPRPGLLGGTSSLGSTARSNGDGSGTMRGRSGGRKDQKGD